MDELEARIGALETAFIEAFAWVDPMAIDDAIASIRSGLHNCDELERTQRLGAIQLLTDARDRFKPPAMGFSMPMR